MSELLPKPDMGCHRTGFDKNCRDLVASGRCKRWMQVVGADPNTGEPVNRFDCVDNWIPILLIENSQQQRQTAAAVESFRNEMVDLNTAGLAMTMSEGNLELREKAVALAVRATSKRIEQK